MYRIANLQNCILYIYSTNVGTEYFKHGVYSPFFFSLKWGSFHNSNLFGSCIIYILYTGCAKIKKNNSGGKRLIWVACWPLVTKFAGSNPAEAVGFLRVNKILSTSGGMDVCLL